MIEGGCRVFRVLRRPIPSPSSAPLFEWRAVREGAPAITTRICNRAVVAGKWSEVPPECATVRVFVAANGNNQRYAFEPGEDRAMTAANIEAQIDSLRVYGRRSPFGAPRRG